MKRMFLTAALAMASIAGYSQADDKGYDQEVLYYFRQF